MADFQSAEFLEALGRRIRGEYSEMPGLSLTVRQARRLWNLEPEVCASLLESLVVSGFLRRVHCDVTARNVDLTCRGHDEWYFVRLHNSAS